MHKKLRRRAVIYKSYDDNWQLIACVIEGFSDKSDVVQENSRHYPSGVVLFEDWLTFKDVEEVVEGLQKGEISLGKFHLRSKGDRLWWQRVRHSLDNPYMQNAGYVWSADFHDLYNTPSGELLAKDVPYYPSLNEALMDWLPLQIFRQNSNPNKGAVIMLMPETRAYFAEAVAKEEAVELKVSGVGVEALSLLVKGAWWDKEKIHHFSVPVSKGCARFELPHTARQLEYVLMDDKGVVYDYQKENEHNHSGLGVLQNRNNKKASSDKVLETCHNGEGLNVEFKPYINPKDGKFQEVVKTAAAFANAEGGQILLGVSDECEIEGINEALAELTKLEVDEEACKKYLGTIDGKILEKLRENVSLSFSQVAIDGRWIAIIEVEESTSKPVTITGDDKVLYVRRGATNAKARPEEWVGIVSSAGNKALLPFVNIRQ